MGERVGMEYESFAAGQKVMDEMIEMQNEEQSGVVRCEGQLAK